MPTAVPNDQVTAVLELPETLALNCCVPLAPKLKAPGVMVTETAGVRVTTAVADFVGSAVEVALTVTVCEDVIDAGAV